MSATFPVSQLPSITPRGHSQQAEGEVVASTDHGACLLRALLFHFASFVHQGIANEMIKGICMTDFGACLQDHIFSASDHQALEALAAIFKREGSVST